jgi:hypothetical protein
LKPIITLYPTGSKEQSKKFEGYISAAFWIGVDHAEADIGSVKVRQPVESYDEEVATLTEFAGLMVQRQITFSVEFFREPEPQGSSASEEGEAELDTAGGAETRGEEVNYEAELTKIKTELQKGLVTRKQYEAKKGELLKRWKERLEDAMENQPSRRLG